MQNQSINQNLKYYQIQSKSAGRVLDLCQEGANKGKLIIYDTWNSPHQQFGIIHTNLEVILVNKATGLYLTVADNSDQNGAVIIEMPPNNSPSQRFRIQ